MGTVTDIRTRIKTTMQAVSGVGQVHDYERFSIEPSTFVSFFVSNSHVNGWTISLGMESSWSAFSSVDRLYRITIRGYRVVNDAEGSAKLFGEELDGVMTALENDWHLNGIVETLDGGLKGTDPEYRMFGEVLCHYVEIAATYHKERVLT